MFDDKKALQIGKSNNDSSAHSISSMVSKEQFKRENVLIKKFKHRISSTQSTTCNFVVVIKKIASNHI